MNSPAVNNSVLESYLALLNSLNKSSKDALLARLNTPEKATASTDKSSENAVPRSAFQESFGAWVSEESAEEIIADLRASRTFTRQIESF